VLYVEDDRVLRASMDLRVFRKLGVPYDTAEDGQRAVELVGEREIGYYSIVLMDNQMPNMRGHEATRVLRAAGYKGLIIGMTGDPRGSSDRAEFENCGIDECIEKDTPGTQRLAAIIKELCAESVA